MRRVLRFSPALLFMLPWLVTACEETAPTGTDAPAASARPPVEIVARTVNIRKNMTTRPVDGQGEDDKWTAVDGKVYAVVTVDIAHNACKAGDKIETSKALLKTPEGEVKPVGGGPKDDKLCVQCQPTEALDCNTAGRLRPYTFIFEVAEKGDVKKATLHYAGREAPLGVARMSDSRANEELSKEIEAKQEELSKLKKELENTSNIANGKVIQSEMERIQKEIEALEKKQN